MTHGLMEVFLLLQTDLLENSEVAMDGCVGLQLSLEDFPLSLKCLLDLGLQPFVIIAQFHH